MDPQQNNSKGGRKLQDNRRTKRIFKNSENIKQGGGLLPPLFIYKILLTKKLLFFSKDDVRLNHNGKGGVFFMDLSSPLTALKGVGEKRQKAEMGNGIDEILFCMNCKVDHVFIPETNNTRCERILFSIALFLCRFFRQPSQDRAHRR
jgi:hypothetical protein